MSKVEVHRQRVTLRIEFDLESASPRIDDARRVIELAAADIVDTCREQISEHGGVRVDSCAMRSNAAPVPGMVLHGGRRYA